MYVLFFPLFTRGLGIKGNKHLFDKRAFCPSRLLIGVEILHPAVCRTRALNSNVLVAPSGRGGGFSFSIGWLGCRSLGPNVEQGEISRRGLVSKGNVGVSVSMLFVER